MYVAVTYVYLNNSLHYMQNISRLPQPVWVFLRASVRRKRLCLSASRSPFPPQLLPRSRGVFFLSIAFLILKSTRGPVYFCPYCKLGVLLFKLFKLLETSQLWW